MADLHAVDRLDEGLLARFRATLGPWLAEGAPGAAPPGAHWCLFPPLADTAQLGPDGHPPRLHAVSEAAFPRRMWVGGQLDLLRPFPADLPIERHSRLRPIVPKQGAGGPFMLTGFDHSYSWAGATGATERQDIVYRAAARGPAAAPHPGGLIPAADLRVDLPTPDTLLFRYSALTFNAHRIHFDRPHAVGVEGHEGLLVHGPLQATILLNLAVRLGGRGGRRRPPQGGRGLVATASRTAGGISGAIHDGEGRQSFEATLVPDGNRSSGRGPVR
jgi:3-methylfumaryl-CoA hydratase